MNEIFKNLEAEKPYKRTIAHLGYSDIAALVMVGCRENQGAVAELLNFGGDNEYKAYIVNEAAEIPSHYKKVAEFKSWLKIYDDVGLVFNAYTQKINVFRAGDYGLIIQGDFDGINKNK